VQAKVPPLIARIENLERQSAGPTDLIEQLRAQYPVAAAQAEPWRALAAGFAALVAEIEAKLAAPE